MKNETKFGFGYKGNCLADVSVAGEKEIRSNAGLDSSRPLQSTSFLPTDDIQSVAVAFIHFQTMMPTRYSLVCVPS